MTGVNALVDSISYFKVTLPEEFPLPELESLSHPVNRNATIVTIKKNCFI